MDSDKAIKIIGESKDLYNQIAEDFSRTRSSIWPEFKGLVKYFKENDRVLDLGCGNGRFFEILKEKNVQYFGLDNSEKLIEVAREKYPQANFSTYDGFKIPFEDNSFDQVFCIAVLHHIPSRQLRVQFLKEAQRVLKKDGLLILTTWYMWQNSKYLKKLFQNWFLKIKGQSDLDWLDAYVNWGKQGQRYIHYFTKKELGGIIKESGFSIDHLGFLNRESKQKNLFVLAKKKI